MPIQFTNKMGTLEEKTFVCDKSFVFGNEKKHVTDVNDIKESLKRFKKRIKKYYKEDVNSLMMSFDLFCLELNNEFGSSLCK